MATQIKAANLVIGHTYLLQYNPPTNTVATSKVQQLVPGLADSFIQLGDGTWISATNFDATITVEADLGQV